MVGVKLACNMLHHRKESVFLCHYVKDIWSMVCAVGSVYVRWYDLCVVLFSILP